MAALVAVLALGLMAYVPGRYLLRLFTPDPAEPLRGRLLLELLLGNTAVGLSALALAEAGIFSLGNVLTCLAFLAVGAALAGRGHGSPAYVRTDLAGIGFAALVVLWVWPPFDTSLFGWDSSVYIASGRSLARHGSLPFVDPTVEEIPRDARTAFFPSYGIEAGRSPFLRAAGGLLLTSLDSPRVLPAFHPLLSSWVALATRIGGDGAAAAPAPYFAALAVWAVALFAYTLSGGVTAALVTSLLLLSAPQYWYSRFLMPEVPSQFFLWAGLAAATASCDTRNGLLGAVAGLGFGMAGLMRLDGLAHTLAALALWKALTPGSVWPAARGFVPAFALVALWAVLHQVLFPTHYYAEVLSLLERGLTSLFGDLPQLLGATAVLGVVAASAAATRAHRWTRGAMRIGAAAVFAAYIAATVMTTRPRPGESMEWLTLYFGWPLLAAAAAGGVLWATTGRRRSERFALLLSLVVLFQLVYDPRVTPAPLWAVRRFVPVVLPAILLAAGLAIGEIAHRRRWLAGVACLACLAGIATRNAVTYGGNPLQGTVEHVRALGGLLPPDAVVIFDPSFAVDSQAHIALWGLADHPAYVLDAAMRESLLALRGALSSRPLYWLGRPTDSGHAALHEIAEPVATYRFSVNTRRLDWYDTREESVVRDNTIWLYRLRRIEDEAPLH